jgi:hypothetical protein
MLAKRVRGPCAFDTRDLVTYTYWWYIAIASRRKELGAILEQQEQREGWRVQYSPSVDLHLWLCLVLRRALLPLSIPV